MGVTTGHTNDKQHRHANVMVLGAAKSGKTTFGCTFPGVVILDTDLGTSVARDKKIPSLTITPIEDKKGRETHLVLNDILSGFRKKSGELYTFLGDYKVKTIFLDSGSMLSDLLEVDATIKPRDGKPRDGTLQLQDYNWIQRRLYQIIRDFAALPYNFVVSFGIDQRQDSAGRLKENPAATGQKLGPQLPHFFDDVLRFYYDPSGKRFMCSPVPSRTFEHAGSRLHVPMKEYSNATYETFEKHWSG